MEWNKSVWERFYEVFKRDDRQSVYKHPALLSYSQEEIDEIASYINKKYDLAHSISSVTTFCDKYLVKGEVIQFVTMVDTMIYASVEARVKRLSYIKDWYEAFAKREISKATPHWTE